MVTELDDDVGIDGSWSAKGCQRPDADGLIVTIPMGRYRKIWEWDVKYQIGTVK